MANMKVVVPIFLVIASIIASGSEAYVSCDTVVSYLTPCAQYVMRGGYVPPVMCCNNIMLLSRQARMPSDRQGVCRCIKGALAGVRFSSRNLQNAATLPAKCRVNLPFKIDPYTNCNRIH